MPRVNSNKHFRHSPTSSIVKHKHDALQNTPTLICGTMTATRRLREPPQMLLSFVEWSYGIVGHSVLMSTTTVLPTVCICVCVFVCLSEKDERQSWGHAGKKVPISLDRIRTCTSGIRAHRASDYTTRAGTPRVSRNKHFRHSPTSSIVKHKHALRNTPTPICGTATVCKDLR